MKHLICGILSFTLLLLQYQSVASESYSESFNDYVRKQLLPEQRADVFAIIKNGTMKGFTARASQNNTIYSFMHIPFAAPSVGDLRFKAPQEALGWGSEILDATRLTPACPQFLTGVVQPQEDCLFLNVYTPRHPDDDSGRPPAPVMVFMFGGGFGLGESSYYTGHRLLNDDVILVVPNYRVNIFGFLSTGDLASPGNYGLKDQNMALRWVQENIGAFGGDPNRVTIFGESAGAASVMYHLVSPKSRGLFHNVIAQSGTPLSPWSVDHEPQIAAKRIAEHVNCPSETIEEIIACMMELPTLNITQGYFEQLVVDLSGSDMKLLGTTPVIEPEHPDAFLTEDPMKTLLEGNVPDVPIILGCNSEEGSLIVGGFHFLGFGRPDVINDTIDQPEWMREDMLNTLLQTFDIKPGQKVHIEEIFGLGFLPHTNRLNFSLITDELVDMMSVMAFKAPVLKTVDIVSRHMSNVYLYSFEYTNNAKNSLWYYVFDLFVPIVGGTVPPLDHGVIHADDLIYMFNLPFILDEKDEAFSQVYTKLWTNFAIHGNPTPEATANYPVWPRWQLNKPDYMVLRDSFTVATDYTQQWRRNRQ